MLQTRSILIFLTAIAAVIVLFASGPLAASQALAFGGFNHGFGFHHFGFHRGFGGWGGWAAVVVVDTHE